jgi:hypothetical protein
MGHDKFQVMVEVPALFFAIKLETAISGVKGVLKSAHVA